MTESARILVVGDEAPVCKTVAGALASDEHVVDTVLSAEEALSKAETTEYDVVIIDLMMPFTPKELHSLVARALAIKRYRGKDEVAPPPGVYCIPENSWASLAGDDVRIGIHHVLLKTIPGVTSLNLPAQGEMRYQGEACAAVTDFTGHVHKVWAPVSGRIVDINDQIIGDYSPLLSDPYGRGWLFLVVPTDLEDDLKNLVRVGEH